MSKDPNQLQISVGCSEEPIDLDTPPLSEQQNDLIDRLVDNGGFNYTEAHRIAGAELPKAIAQPALKQIVAKPTQRDVWEGPVPYSELDHVEKQQADEPPAHIRRQMGRR